MYNGQFTEKKLSDKLESLTENRFINFIALIVDSVEWNLEIKKNLYSPQ